MELMGLSSGETVSLEDGKRLSNRRTPYLVALLQDVRRRNGCRYGNGNEVRAEKAV